jgi:hypothetical protein
LALLIVSCAGRTRIELDLVIAQAPTIDREAD